MMPTWNAARLGTRIVRGAVVFVALLAFGACARNQTSHRTLTERERDSLIARSALPGAVVVGRAMALQDSMAVRSGQASEWTPPADDAAATAASGENP